MKKPMEILEPYIEKVFRHTKIVEAQNAIDAMVEYAKQFQSQVDRPSFEIMEKINDLSIVFKTDLNPKTEKRYGHRYFRKVTECGNSDIYARDWTPEELRLIADYIESDPYSRALDIDQNTGY